MASRRTLQWVVFGLAVMMILVGFILVFLGPESPVQLEIWGITIKSSNLGIVVIVLGVGVVGLVLKHFANAAEPLKKDEDEDEARSTAPDLGFALAVSALAGHPIVHLGDSDIFCGGASVRLTLSRDHAGTSSVVVQKIELGDVQFKPGSRSDLHYKIEANKIFGAGVIKPDRYSISLLGETVLPAKWQDKAGKPSVAQGTNLLTARGEYPQLYPGEGQDVHMIEVQILPQESGYYEIAFEASYTVGAKRNQAFAGPVRIYLE